MTKGMFCATWYTEALLSMCLLVESSELMPYFALLADTALFHSLKCLSQPTSFSSFAPLILCPIPLPGEHSNHGVGAQLLARFNQHYRTIFSDVHRQEYKSKNINNYPKYISTFRVTSALVSPLRNIVLEKQTFASC